MSLHQLTSNGRKDNEDMNLQLPTPGYAGQNTNTWYPPSMNMNMFQMSQWPQMGMPQMALPFAAHGGMPSYNSYAPSMMHNPQQYIQAMQFQRQQQQQSLMLPPFRPQQFSHQSSYYYDQPLESTEISSRDPSVDSLTNGSSAHLTASPEYFAQPSDLLQHQQQFLDPTFDRDATIGIFNCAAACSLEDDYSMVTCAMEGCGVTFHLSCAGLEELPDGPFMCDSCGQHVYNETMRKHNNELATAMSRATSHQNLPQVPILKSQRRASPQSDGSSYHPSPSPAPVKQKKTPGSLKKAQSQIVSASASASATPTVAPPASELKIKQFVPKQQQRQQQPGQQPGQKKKYVRKASVTKQPYDNYGDKLFGPYGSTITQPKRRRPVTSTIAASDTPIVRPPPPGNNPLPNQKGPWSAAEDAACIKLMQHYVNNRDTHKIPIEHMWAHVASDLCTQGFSRTGLGVKMQWTRRLREKCGLDERARPNPEHMKTGLLKREKGVPRNRRSRAKIEKVKTEKVKTGRVAKKGATGRPRKGKKKEEEERKFELSTSPATDLQEAAEKENAAIDKDAEGEVDLVDEGMALVAAYNSEHDSDNDDDDDYADLLALDEDEQQMVGMGHEDQVMGSEEDVTMDWMEQMMSDDVQAGLDEVEDEGYNTRQSSHFSDAFEEMDTVMG